MNDLNVDGVETRKNLFLCERYDDKRKLVSDVLDVCYVHKNLTHLNARKNVFRGYLWNELVNVGGEQWLFTFDIKCDTVSTSALLILPSGQQVSYPRTTWGSAGRKWYSELEEFLMRKVCKEG